MTWQESEGEEWKGAEEPLAEFLERRFREDIANYNGDDGPKRLGMFILDENQSPILADSTLHWGEWYQNAGERRRVGRDVVGQYEVSTVFLGLDHNWSERGWPVLFETMVFRLGEDGDRDRNASDDDELDGRMERYRTWSEAEAGHARMIEEVQQAQSTKRP